MKVLILMILALLVLSLVVLPWAVRRQVRSHHAAATQRKRKQQQHHTIPTHTPAEGIAARR